MSCASLYRLNGCNCTGCCSGTTVAADGSIMGDAELASDLLVEASALLQRNRTQFDRLAVHTGAWYMAETEWSRTTSNCSLKRREHCAYKLDEGLAACLSQFFSRQRQGARSGTSTSVTELGAGVGRYADYIETHAPNVNVTAYDGMLDIEKRTEGRVHHRDFSAVYCAGAHRLKRSDWVLTLEVAEHIPHQYETNFLQNIDCANRQGLVISWSQTRAQQGGIGHLNPQSFARTHGLFLQRGYVQDAQATKRLRQCSQFSFFRNGLFVFVRGNGTAAGTGTQTQRGA